MSLNATAGTRGRADELSDASGRVIDELANMSYNPRRTS